MNREPKLESFDHLFRSMHLSKIFKVSEKDFDQYFGSKLDNFFIKGIQSLPERWAKVINAEGNYFDDWPFYNYIFIFSKKTKKTSKLSLGPNII